MKMYSQNLIFTITVYTIEFGSINQTNHKCFPEIEISAYLRQDILCYYSWLIQ